MAANKVDTYDLVRLRGKKGSGGGGGNAGLIGERFAGRAGIDEDAYI